MLDLIPSQAVIVACFGEAGVLDRLPEGLGIVLRVAPDEAWVLAARSRRDEVLAAARGWLATADPDSLVADQTDGWAIWTLLGERRHEVFGRLSVSPLPPERPAFVQGALSGVAGKALVTNDALHLMVPSPVGHHLRARILEAGADLAPTLRPAAPFEIGSSGGRETAGAARGRRSA